MKHLTGEQLVSKYYEGLEDGEARHFDALVLRSDLVGSKVDALRCSWNQVIAVNPRQLKKADAAT